MDTIRFMVSTASTVCRVESTRCPVSAAVSAISVVLDSRIRPLDKRPGPGATMRAGPVRNEMVFETPLSRWFDDNCAGP